MIAKGFFLLFTLFFVNILKHGTKKVVWGQEMKDERYMMYIVNYLRIHAALPQEYSLEQNSFAILP